MNGPTDFEDEEEAAKRRKKGDSGEGDSDSFGRGKAGAGAGGGIKISAQKLKQVMSEWRQLSAGELVEAVVEFFAEGPMRASANLVVNFVKSGASSVKSFAIVNWAIKSGSDAVREWTRERVRGADAGGGIGGRGKASGGGQKVQPQKTPQTQRTIKQAGPGLGLGPAGPTGAG